jgi:hypothetical protein
MNQYGALAQRHWKTYRPTQYAELTSPDRFFEDLGEEISDQVQTLRDQLQASEQADLNAMGDLERMGRLNAIRRQAEEVVYAELIWPEPTNEDLEANDRQDQSSPETSREDRLLELGAILDEDGGLMPANQQHPLWALWEASIKETSTLESRDSFNSAYRDWLAATPALVDLA